MFDMMKMMGKMKEVQQKMKEAQDRLVNVKASGEAGGGMVRAIVNGKKVKVEGLHDLRIGRQAIFYRINEGKILSSNKFWGKNPVFKG